LIIRLIIQTIRRDLSGSDQIDDPSNVSRPDRSGPDQIDVEHQATDLAVRCSLISAACQGRLVGSHDANGAKAQVRRCQVQVD
jgi:hypothetical protein